jgi:hypothetical protein
MALPLLLPPVEGTVMDDKLKKNQEPDQPQHGSSSRASFSEEKRHSSRSKKGGPDLAEDRDPQSMSGGSQHDRTEHSGTRDVTDGTTGGPETGGSRNFRSGSGATGSDIGNRPE